jgi:hypothetical protein
MISIVSSSSPSARSWTAIWYSSRNSARPGEAGDKAQLDRVCADAENDRDRRGRSFGRK